MTYVRKQLFVSVSRECKLKLDSLKTHPRDTYGDVINKLIKEYENICKLSTKDMHILLDKGTVIGPVNDKEDNKLEQPI